MNEKLYRLMNWPEIEAIIYSEEDDPHRLLGPHREGNATVVQAFYPGAVSMELELPGQKTVEMEQHFAPLPISQVSGKLAHCVRSNSASNLPAMLTK